MRCNHCNSAVEENWNFCATCGATIIRNPDMITKAIEASVMSSLQAIGMKGYAIRVIPSRQNAICEHKPCFRHEAQDNFLATPGKPLPVVEPKTDITRLPGRMALELELPEVSSGNYIKIMLLGESIEIRAIAPEKMYLKILHIPRNLRLARSVFNEGKLRVELGDEARNRL